MKLNIENKQLPFNSPIAITINRGKGNLQRFIWHLRYETTTGYYCTEHQSQLHETYNGQFFAKDSAYIQARPVKLGLIENNE